MRSYDLDTVSGPELEGTFLFFFLLMLGIGCSITLPGNCGFLVTFALSKFPGGLPRAPDLPIYTSF